MILLNSNFLYGSRGTLFIVWRGARLSTAFPFLHIVCTLISNFWSGYHIGKTDPFLFPLARALQTGGNAIELDEEQVYRELHGPLTRVQPAEEQNDP